MTIISFKHHFIFVRPIKVAGTSMEVALSRFCGPDDLMSLFDACEPESTRLREKHYPYPVCDKTGVMMKGKEQRLGSHRGVKFIRHVFGKDIFERFLKISIIRNPYDMVVSRYAYFTRGKPGEKTVFYFRENFTKCYDRVRVNRDLCTLKAPYDAIDVMIRFEHFKEDLTALSSRLGLQENIYDIFKNIHVKGDSRPKSLTTRACFEGFPEGIEKVKEIFDVELEKFGYDLPWVPHKLPQGVSGTRSGTRSGGLSQARKENA